jgi:hypothetical protein
MRCLVCYVHGRWAKQKQEGAELNSGNRLLFYDHVKIHSIHVVPITQSPVAQQPLGGLGLLIIETSRSHSDTQHTVGLLWTSDQPDAGTSTWQHTTLTTDRHPFEPAISAT